MPNGTGSVTVRAEQDSLNEGDETFSLHLSLVSPPPGVHLSTRSVTGTIMDASDDALTASVARGQTTAPEGTTATFIVTLSSDPPGGSSTAPVVIGYTVSGATEGEDYTAPSGALTIPAGSATGTIAIQILDDGVLDRGEMLTVTLDDDSSSTAGALTAQGDASTTIGDASDEVEVSVKDTTVDEGDPALFTVELSGKVSGKVTVAYATADGPDTVYGAKANEDYTETRGDIVIEAGETTTTITVPTVDDDADNPLAEASETFTVTLTDITVTDSNNLPVTNSGVKPGDVTAEATITDDALTATVVGPTEVAEGADAVYTVTVTGGAG